MFLGFCQSRSSSPFTLMEIPSHKIRFFSRPGKGYDALMDEDTTRRNLMRCQEQMRSCHLCAEAGYPITPRAIFSGLATARIMVVGQAPGGREVELGLPFSGPAELFFLKSCLCKPREQSLTRREQYITAITKCYPGKGTSRGDRIPTAAERKLCLPFLARELELVQPELIIPVGGVAIRHFLGNIKLDEAIGQVYEKDGRSIVPLPHPSGANIWLNRPRSKLLLQEALLLLKKRGQATFP